MRPLSEKTPHDRIAGLGYGERQLERRPAPEETFAADADTLAFLECAPATINSLATATWHTISWVSIQEDTHGMAGTTSGNATRIYHPSANAGHTAMESPLLTNWFHFEFEVEWPFLTVGTTLEMEVLNATRASTTKHFAGQRLANADHINTRMAGFLRYVPTSVPAAPPFFEFRIRHHTGSSQSTIFAHLTMSSMRGGLID